MLGFCGGFFVWELLFLMYSLNYFIGFIVLIFIVVNRVFDLILFE